MSGKKKENKSVIGKHVTDTGEYLKNMVKWLSRLKSIFARETSFRSFCPIGLKPKSKEASLIPIGF